MKKYSLRGDAPLVALRRLARMATDTGMLGAFSIAGVPEVLKIAATRGLDVRTIHAVHAARDPSRIAVIDGEEWLTFKEIDERINQSANLLISIGVRPHTRVLICMENRLEYLLAWFALFRLGCSAVHASYRSTSAELDYLVENSKATVAVVSASTAAAVSATKHTLKIVCADGSPGCVPFSEHRKHSMEPSPHVEDADGASVVYTSGTTGSPKGAVRNFTSFGPLELSRLLERLPLRSRSRHLVVCPLYHSAAQAFVLIHAAIGATVVLQRHFEPSQTLEMIRRLAIESTFLVPTMIQRIVELPVDVRGPRPGSLRCLVSGAAPFPQRLREQAIEYFGARAIFDFYGATELGWVTLINGQEMLERPASVGRPLPGQSIRVRKNGADVPVGDVGIIWVDNAQIMAGYLDHDCQKSELDGWMTVDDLGFVDADGYVYLAGRDRDMVISGGVNIYPVEIEEILLTHPSIKDVAVVGIPDKEWGERLVAFVVGDADTSELQSWLGQRLSSHKVPRLWHHVTEVPRNATGKVLKRELEARAQS
jgi:acyl-CoA synthetase (AMP-forming)/AMP-acid ligase II